MGTDRSSPSISKTQLIAASLELMAAGSQVYTFPVRGNSMAPLIQNEGDLLVVSRDITGLQAGDIVLYQDGEQLLAHRLLRVYNDETGSVRYLIKGDRSSVPDPLVNPEQVAGRVIAIRRGDYVMSLEGKAWRWASKAISSALSGWIGLFPSTAQISNARIKKSAILGRVMNRASSVGFSSALWLAQTILGSWERVT